MYRIYVFISIFIIGIILYFSCYKPKIYKFSSKKKGPKILFIAGTHGDEDSGSYNLSRLVNQFKINNIKLKRGTVYIIPNFNKCGILLNSRYYSNIGKKYDLNRLYGKKFIVNKPIEDLIRKEIDIIIDFHDGYDFHKKNHNR